MGSKWLAGFLLISLAGCQNWDDNKSSGKQLVIPELRSVTESNKESSETKYAFIRKIESRDGQDYIQADYVEYLTGDKALKKARAAGDAHYKVSKSGDTTFSLMDSYYISNVNTALRTLELGSEVSIKMVDYSSGRTDVKAATLPGLRSSLKNDPLMILTIVNGKVVSMVEQYRP